VKIERDRFVILDLNMFLPPCVNVKKLFLNN
jgi:hypothetical protein